MPRDALRRAAVARARLAPAPEPLRDVVRVVARLLVPEPDREPLREAPALLRLVDEPRVEEPVERELPLDEPPREEALLPRPVLRDALPPLREPAARPVERPLALRDDEEREPLDVEREPPLPPRPDDELLLPRPEADEPFERELPDDERELPEREPFDDDEREREPLDDFDAPERAPLDDAPEREPLADFDPLEREPLDDFELREREPVEREPPADFDPFEREPLADFDAPDEERPPDAERPADALRPPPLREPRDEPEREREPRPSTISIVGTLTLLRGPVLRWFCSAFNSSALSSSIWPPSASRSRSSLSALPKISFSSSFTWCFTYSCSTFMFASNSASDGPVPSTSAMRRFSDRCSTAASSTRSSSSRPNARFNAG